MGVESRCCVRALGNEMGFVGNFGGIGMEFGGFACIPQDGDVFTVHNGFCHPASRAALVH